MVYSPKKENGKFVKRFFLFFSLFLLLFSMTYTVSAMADAQTVYQGVIRLHILADSDEDEAQKIKLSVRDAILTVYQEELSKLSSVSEAEAVLSEKLDEIRSLAEETLRQNGCRDTVTATLVREYHPTRVYDGFSLPAGNYLSLRLEIGAGQGKNWFCMVYPPLCTASCEADEALLAAGFTEDEVRFLTEGEEGYTVKFKLVETVAECVEAVKGWFR